MDEQIIINIILITLLFFTTAEYSIDMKRIYPFWMMQSFSEPYIRFLLYTLVYVLSCYNIQISLLFGIIVVLLHIDYINLT
jgi:hypothetical protein